MYWYLKRYVNECIDIFYYSVSYFLMILRFYIMSVKQLFNVFTRPQKKPRNITLRFEYICTKCTVAFQFLYHYSSGAGTSHPSTGTWAHHRSSVRFCWLLWSVLWTIVFSFCLFYRLATVLSVLLRYNASDNPFGTAVLSAGYR
jgi:hypothetical protein